MNEPNHIAWDKIHQLFSIVMCVDRELNIVYSSATLLKYMPGLARESKLEDSFNAIRPSNIGSFELLLEKLDSLFLFTARDNSFAIRGQLVHTLWNGREVCCFCGAPWLFWIHSKRPELALTLEDFSTQDVQLDQLFFMSSEKKMVADLERLNSDLLNARKVAEQAHEEKEKFFAQMSHEMRTPLNGVVSALSLLEDQSLTGESAMLVSLGRAASRNLMEVINYVLDVSKLESKESYTAQDLIMPRKLMQSVKDIVQARAVQKSLVITIETDIPPDQTYLGDSRRLKQSLLNLAINAIKFTDKGSVTLRASVLEECDQRDTVRFEVVDTGIGIARENRQHIFEPFWSTGNSSQASQQEGTGLGLDIVRRNVEFMQGHLGLDSTLGLGSLFWFQLPMKTENDQLPSPIFDETNSPGKTVRFSGDVLLVDDNSTNLILSRMILESMGLNVIPVAGGAEAVKAAQSREFDLVLMDINMPGMDGCSATRKIRQFKNKLQLPIVALTAFASGKERLQSSEAGMNGYLTKPIERDLLAGELQRWLEHSVSQADTTPHTYENLVDLAVLQKLIPQIGRENFHNVIAAFLDEAEMTRKELLEAVEAEDIDGVLRCAHALSSTCCSFGLPIVGKGLAEIEVLAKNGVIADLRDIESSNFQLLRGTEALQDAMQLF